MFEGEDVSRKEADDCARTFQGTLGKRNERQADKIIHSAAREVGALVLLI